MLLMQIFLPRFLVLELVLFLHFVHLGQAKFDSRAARQEDSCSLDITNLDARFEPLFFHKKGSDFLLPIKNDAPGGNENDQILLKVKSKDSLTATCPGTSFRSVKSDSMSFQCSKGEEFLKDGTPVATSDLISELSCSKSILETISEPKNSECGPPEGGGKLVDVGWPKGDDSGQLLTQYSVCHSKSLEHTFYSIHQVHGEALSSKNVDPGRPSNFKEGKGFFVSRSASTAYNTRTQGRTFQQLLGPPSTKEYFSPQKFYLARGHLSPDADFVYKEWQDATYYFFNVAPQWQPFNNGNWKSVESLVRKYAEANRKTLTVFTGTFGQLKLPNDKGEMTPISLVAEENLIPVPNLLWKLVHDPESNKAIVMFGVNNPHATVKDIADEGLILCSDETDLCSAQSWTFPHRKNTEKGYLYCCSYQSAKAAIDWLPSLNSPELLTFEDPTKRTSPRRPSREVSRPKTCILELHGMSDKKNAWPPIFYNGPGDPILPKTIMVENSHNDSLEFDIFYTYQKVISVDEGDTLTVACPGNKLKISEKPSTQYLCSNGTLTTVDQNKSTSKSSVKYSDLSCTKSIKENIRSTRKSCGPPTETGSMVEIGWTLERSFKPMISVCHNKNKEHTYYAFHKLAGGSLQAVDRDHKRPTSFQEGDAFYGQTVANALYKQRNQEKVFESLGLSKFLNRSQDLVLNRGHLAPNGDFIYKEWQDATFYYFNVAPQWKRFNSGNWLAVETEVRNLALHLKKTLNIYTGTYKVLTLPDSQGSMKEVFLDQRRLIPVPLFYWKIAHEPLSNKAIVLVGINSPEEIKTIPSSLQLCPDICLSSHWHFYNKNKSEKGIIYCCSYQDFKNAIPWIDFLNNPAVLEG